jgi:anti-sigma regulatory factor (Ser/Thr protein kinase)
VTRVAGDEETATDIMVAIVVSADLEQVGIARRLVRAALEYAALGGYANDAEAVAAELVANAIQHATVDVNDKVAVTLMRVWDGQAVAVVVTDPSPLPPVPRQAGPGSERGRGLHIVAGLSAYWSWNHEPGGKAVWSILTARACR